MFLVAGLALVASLGATGCHHCKWGDDPKNFRVDLERKLGPVLKPNDVQREQMAPIIDRVTPEVGQLALACNKLHAAIIAEWSRPDPDRARVQELAEAFADTAKRVGRDLISGAFDLHEILTPEQRTALLEHVLGGGGKE
jgi:Spy/CpxP family protein refolding chaperone